MLSDTIIIIIINIWRNRYTLLSHKTFRQDPAVRASRI